MASEKVGFIQYAEAIRGFIRLHVLLLIDLT